MAAASQDERYELLPGEEVGNERAQEGETHVRIRIREVGQEHSSFVGRRCRESTNREEANQRVARFACES